MSEHHDVFVDHFLELFRGRGDCYGSWEGGCVKQPLTRRQFEQHLTCGPHIGVYPLISDQCSWGCIDIDGKQHQLRPNDASQLAGDDVSQLAGGVWDWDEMHRIAENLRDALAYKDITAWLERTRNGIHVWVFPDQPLVPAATMRRALMAACTVVGYDPKEVNPKQESLSDGQVGNYVRAPYPGILSDAYQFERYMLTDDRELMPFAQFLQDARQNRTALGALEAVAALWSPPRTKHEINPNTSLDINTIWPILPGIAKVIWRDGPLEGADRSNTLARLAHELAEAGIQPAAAFTVVKTADERWGKFYDRPDCDEQLVRILERAYT